MVCPCASGLVCKSGINRDGNLRRKGLCQKRPRGRPPVPVEEDKEDEDVGVAVLDWWDEDDDEVEEDGESGKGGDKANGTIVTGPSTRKGTWRE